MKTRKIAQQHKYFCFSKVVTVSDGFWKSYQNLGQSDVLGVASL